MNGDYKFAWLRAVYAEPRFTDGEKAVLAYVAVFSVFTGEITFCVRQSTLAAADHCGISRQTVGSAIRRAKRLGYLVEAGRRLVGRGYHGADPLKLVLPAVSKESLHVSAEDQERVKQTAETCKETGQERVKKPAKTCKAANASTSENRGVHSSCTSSLNSSWEQVSPNGEHPQENPSQEQEQKPRPQLGRMVHGVIKSTSLNQAGEPYLSPRAQAAIDAARAGLDRAEKENRHEQDGPT